MRSLGTRRATLVAGAATVAALALGGCSAGQVAETAILDTPIAGVNAQSENGSVLIRNLQVEYNGVEGYHAQEDAPLEVNLYNQSNEAVTVTISPQPVERPQVVTGTRVGFVSTATVTTPGQVGTPASGEPSSGASAEPEASTPPAEPATSVQPAQIKIGPQGSAVFRPTDASQLQILGLQEELKPGMAVALVFEFSNGDAKLNVEAPVASPLTPAPRGSAEIEEAEGGH
ncbi:hypothetical protein [Actinoplanes derwentensis]|uniref:Copper(I)-binding protein n=1 Tax=Actinoplanes derwentensis TaxID=113562 RepID=A0A1H2CYB7_9ACTN|nr:hypothetical protein [Actinoplanes derwentensis]GID82936.1 hypothetical protein Ade03nite_18600 [Actinoplanes derwentensis]SDT75495.1 hypothetical protein SAMN04489716_7319 [Actinoplanes derwentensis]